MKKVCNATMIRNRGAMNRYHLSRGTPIKPQFSVQAVGQNISEKPSPKQ